MKYKLFVSDFDGTLVRDDGTVSKTNRTAIGHYQKAGGIFAVCSGRLTASILSRVRELGLSGVLASFQGAVLSDIATGRVLSVKAFENERAYEIVRTVQDMGYHTHIYTEKEMYCNRDDEALKFYEKVCSVKAIVVPDLYALAKREALKIIKIVAFVSDGERLETAKKFNELFSEDCYVTCSAKYLVEIMPKGIDKGTAVRCLAEYYKLCLSEVAAIGDMENDIPMIKAAGGKFAVGNAEEELKRIATVVPSCEDDGVAYALKKYALEEEDE